jgi:hypothetical protein
VPPSVDARLGINGLNFSVYLPVYPAYMVHEARLWELHNWSLGKQPSCKKGKTATFLIEMPKPSKNLIIIVKWQVLSLKILKNIQQYIISSLEKNVKENLNSQNSVVKLHYFFH